MSGAHFKCYERSKRPESEKMKPKLDMYLRL